MRLSARLQLVLPEDTVARIDRLRMTTGIPTAAGVIRRAIEVRHALAAAGPDARIVIERPDGTRERLLLP